MTKKTRPYFTLFVLIPWGEDFRWSPEFGAYDRSDVEGERQDQRDHGVKAKNLNIVRTDDTQFAVFAALKRLNGDV